LRPLIVLALIALLAGCFTPEAPVEAASLPDASQADAAPVVSATDGAEGTLLIGRDFPFAFEGKTGTDACVPSGPNSCTGLPMGGTPSDKTFTEVIYAGTPTSIEATLTWEADTPATAEMYLAVFAARSCGDRCYEWGGDAFYERVSGPSPLSVSATNVQLGEDETLHVNIGLDRKVPYTPGVYFQYSVEQPFSITGNVVALVPAEENAS
jgi:hypothetical protein